MIEMEVFKQDLTAVRNMIAEAGESLHVDHLREQLVEYQEDMGSNGFWDDTERATRISAKANSTENRIKHYESLINRADEIEIMMELAEEEDDESMAEDIKKEFASLKEDLESLRLQTLLTGEYDDCNCILTLHAGAGGTEAQDWTQMLYRMYTRYCEKMGFTVKVLDYLDGDEAGIKSVSFEVTGDYAYGYLKAERGVHRLVRISPFDSNARRHTSFASLDVRPSSWTTARSRFATRICASTPTARPARAVSTSTVPTPPCASPTCPPASWCSARTSAVSSRTRRCASSGCARSWPS